MESYHTKKSTRIIIWVITIVMAFGFLGSYVLVILNNNDALAAESTTTTDTTDEDTELTVDPTAYVTTEEVTSLQITDLVVGTGDEVQADDTVTIDYKGTIAATGEKFGSSYDTGEPISITLSEVIDGVKEGVTGMEVGGKRRLVIPSSMAYGDQETSGIPANSALVFEIEVLSIDTDTATSE